MTTYCEWIPYSGNSAIILAFILLIISGALGTIGLKLNRRIEAKRPGKFIGFSIVVLFILSGFSFLTSVATYVQELIAQIGPLPAQANPITPITAISGLVTFVLVAYLSRRSGFITALGSAIAATIAAPMVFELPFDLIVISRTCPPSPAVQFSLLFFLPLFAVAISSFALLALSPVAKLSKYTLFCLAGMFLVFAVWALSGFQYPASAMPIIFNGVSKVLAFAAVVALFVPLKQTAPEVSAPDKTARVDTIGV